MALRYYYDLMSQPSRAVYMFMKINKIPFESKPIALRKGEHLEDEYKMITPFQRVPVLDDNGFVLTESVAILKYLATSRDVPDHWYPANKEKQARVDEYMNWQHGNTRRSATQLFRTLVSLGNTRLHATMLFQTLLMDPASKQTPIDWDRAKHMRAEVTKTIGFIESYFLKNQLFLCGNEISVADLLGVCELSQLYGIAEENLFKENSTMHAWMERVRDKLQPHYDQVHKVVAFARPMALKFKGKL